MLPRLILLAAAATLPGADDPPRPPLNMTDAIPCISIQGYEDYVPREEAVLTADEKLLLYMRPRNHTFVEKGDKFVVHLVQDVNIRRKGKRKVLLGREKVIEYNAESDLPPENLFIGTTLGLKGFPPGEYEAELILRDLLRDGKAATATQTVKFRVVRTKPAEGESSPPAEKPGAGSR